MRFESPSGILALTIPEKPWQFRWRIEVFDEVVDQGWAWRSAVPQREALRSLTPTFPAPAQYEAKRLLSALDAEGESD